MTSNKRDAATNAAMDYLKENTKVVVYDMAQVLFEQGAQWQAERDRELREEMLEALKDVAARIAKREPQDLIGIAILIAKAEALGGRKDG